MYTLILAVKIYSQDVGVVFAIAKCTMQMMKRNRNTKSWKNQNVWRKETLQILGIIGSGHHQTNGDERKNYKKNTPGERELLETKLQSRNLIRRINALYVSSKGGGRGFTSIQDSVDASIQGLEDCIKNAEEDWQQVQKIILTTQASTDGK